VYNKKIYDNVFPFLRERKIRYLFASSIHSSVDSVYGIIKRKGEEIVNASVHGKSFKIWNAYGIEPIGLKSHVLTDWLWQCLQKGQVVSKTDGMEMRQFMFVDDMADALVSMMEDFESLSKMTALTTGHWISMREAAQAVKVVLKSDIVCDFTFPDTSAQFRRGIEPTNLWKVESDLMHGIGVMAEHYKSLMLEHSTWKTRNEIYLSIVIVCRNDNYAGIRSRLFKFIEVFSKVADESNLDYELIVVQYNPLVSKYLIDTTDYDRFNFERDLPLSMMLPLTPVIATTRLRIITVPPRFHKFADKGAVWEYMAKNVGGRHARGRFVLFTNPDNLFPRSMVSWISKRNLSPDRVYRSGRRAMPAQDEQDWRHVCDVAGQGKGVCIDKGICTVKEDPSTYFTMACLGDFIVISRDLFLKTTGFAELPQQAHIDTAYMIYVKRVFPSIKWVFMDDVMCHMPHPGKNHAGAIDFHKIAANMHPNPSFGLPDVVLNESRTDSVFDMGFNPETPWRLYRHHDLMQQFAGKIWVGDFEPGFLRDFVGTRTKYLYDCENWNRYRRFHLSRRIPCDRHDVLKTHFSGRVFGDLPVMDEEYFEWLSLPRAVKDRAEIPGNRSFVAVELGSRYGTWIARAARAMQTLNSSITIRVCAVEGDETGFRWLQEHVSVNVPSSNHHKLLRGVVGRESGMLKAPVWEPGSKNEMVPSFSIAEVLRDYDMVDIMHVDIQTAEGCLLDAGSVAVLNAKVKHIHVGTHTQSLHQKMQRGFSSMGWRLNHEYAPGGGGTGRLVNTSIGAIRFFV
jgi:hypothetical protein